jgi:hypothetical protein
MERFVMEREEIETLPSVAVPTTVRFPLIVSLLVTSKEFTTALVVTVKEYKVAAPLVPKIPKLVVPAADKFPPTFAFESTERVVVFRAEVAVEVLPK